MAEEQIIVSRRTYAFAKTMETERRLKQEAAASLQSSDFSYGFVRLFSCYAFDVETKSDKLFNFQCHIFKCRGQACSV